MSNVSLINGHIDELKCLTDEEIIEAMKCCCGNKGTIECDSKCYQSALSENRNDDTRWCRQWLIKDALELIKRLKADNNALIIINKYLMDRKE